MVIIITFYWQKVTSPEIKIVLQAPTNLQAFGEYKSVLLIWDIKTIANGDIFKIYYGKKHSEYTDTIYTDNNNYFKINNLDDDTQYYFAISILNRFQNESTLSAEISTVTYFSFADFNQSNGPLNPEIWHTESNFITPVTDNHVEAVEIEKYMGKITKSFGQYNLSNPLDDFIIECQFKIGHPNVGGAGIMARAQKARHGRYYKGYLAYLFWVGDRWELRLEESNVDYQAMENVPPVILTDIKSNDWIKISFQKKGTLLEAVVRNMSDYSVIGIIQCNYKKRGIRPKAKDNFCGFYTCQYGRNTIQVDNFGLKRVL